MKTLTLLPGLKSKYSQLLTGIHRCLELSSEKMRTFFFCLFFFISTLTTATPDWGIDATIEPGGRRNPFHLSPADFEYSVQMGQIHSQIYPITVTGVLLPERPIKNLFSEDSPNLLKQFFREIIRDISGFVDYNSFLKWVGLLPYPRPTDPREFQIALPDGKIPDYPLGYSRIQRGETTLFTMSCATCHSGQLFGQTILGLNKRFPRGNEFIHRAKGISSYYIPHFFKYISNSSKDELSYLNKAFKNLNAIAAKKPLVLGLDTSLAQVSLSLNLREENEHADKNEEWETFPREDLLETEPADSKPAVWWNVKYKNRWLSDGSVLSGNPIFTNFLWNEIGRGTDLRELDTWLIENDIIVQELTTAVFASEAPRIEMFFPAERIDPHAARRGENIFNSTCARCHGHYVKNWGLPDYADAPWSEQMKTHQVLYPQKTKVVNVGTDPQRFLLMKNLEKLNQLNISKRNGIFIQAQQGYVPPPLVGIWARWPYFHNNAIPNLCVLLTPSKLRPKTYYAGEPRDRHSDFDFECNGYPLGDKTPVAWKSEEYFFNSQRKGLSNSGHDEGIFIKNGQELLSTQDKQDLIQFLQTL